MKKLWPVVYNTFKIFLLVIGFSVIGEASQDQPESITFNQLHELYEPVIFEHQMHADMLSCSSCHHHLKGVPEEENTCINCHAQENTQAKVTCQSCHLPLSAAVQKNVERDQPFSFYHLDIPTLKGALHLQCVGCHRDEGGPTGCRECHAFSEKGKKRFRVKQ